MSVASELRIEGGLGVGRVVGTQITAPLSVESPFSFETRLMLQWIE